MSKPYCGMSSPPSGSRRGTRSECLEMNQVRYYGIKKVKMDKLKLEKELKDLKKEKSKYNLKVIVWKKKYNNLVDKYEIFKERNKKDPKDKNNERKMKSQYKEALKAENKANDYLAKLIQIKKDIADLEKKLK